jgi:pilus assembly protein CpaB
MSVRTILVVVLALVCGLSAAVGVNMLRGNVLAAPGHDTVPVVVAAVDVPRFTTLSTEMLRTRDCPRDLVPPGALTRVEDGVDRVSFTQMVRGEPVLDTMLAVKGVGRGIAPGITAGMRAIAILVPNVSMGVAGFLLPGNRVDVQLTVSGIGSNEVTGGATSVILLQDVEVLAVDQRLDPPAENKIDPNQLRSVTLLVTPKQAVELTLAQNKGTLHLTLRNPQDKQELVLPPTTLADLGLLGGQPSKAVVIRQETAHAPVFVRTLRGSRAGWVQMD